MTIAITTQSLGTSFMKCFLILPEIRAMIKLLSSSSILNCYLVFKMKQCSHSDHSNRIPVYTVVVFSCQHFLPQSVLIPGFVYAVKCDEKEGASQISAQEKILEPIIESQILATLTVLL